MDTLIKYRKYIGLGGCLLAIIGCFLPWATALGYSVSFVDGDGKYLIIATIVSAILIYLKKDKISLIPTIIAVVIYLKDALNTFSSNVSLGLGIFLILIGLVGMVIYPFIKENN